MDTTRISPDVSDHCVKHAHVQEHTARAFLVLEHIRGNPGSVHCLPF